MLKTILLLWLEVAVLWNVGDMFVFRKYGCKYMIINAMDSVFEDGFIKGRPRRLWLAYCGYMIGSSIFSIFMWPYEVLNGIKHRESIAITEGECKTAVEQYFKD